MGMPQLSLPCVLQPHILPTLFTHLPTHTITHPHSLAEVASHGKVKLQLIGDVRGRDVILSDHIIDSGKSLCERVTLLKQAGCERVVASATHGIFSGKALQRISRSPLSDVVVTNTVPLREGVDTRDLHKLSQISVAPLLASAIIRSQLDISLQPLKSARVVVADASEHK